MSSPPALINTTAALTILKGTHTFKTGFDYRYYTVDWDNPTPLAINANGRFTGGPNAQAISSNTGSGIADLLLGVAAVSYNINPQHVNSHPYYAGYFQDQWRATQEPHADARPAVQPGARQYREIRSLRLSRHYQSFAAQRARI